MSILDLTPEKLELHVKDVASTIVPHTYTQRRGYCSSLDAANEFVQVFNPILIDTIAWLPLPLEPETVRAAISELCGVPAKIEIFNSLQDITIKCMVTAWDGTEHTYRFSASNMGQDLEVYITSIKIFL